MVGLGCEDNQIPSLMEDEKLVEGPSLRTLIMQDQGGTRSSIKAGIESVKEMLAAASSARREAIPASELVVGLQCGGSDSFSGISANPALGVAVDRLVACGGTALLSETPEIYGAESLLLERAVDRQVGETLIGLLDWWEEHTRDEPQGLDNNPSPGNKAGGLTTILEKSLGAVAKGGSTNLTEVIAYAARAQPPRPRLHGFARLRSDLGHRSGGGRRQSDLFHHRAGLLFRLPARTFPEARHQHGDVPAHAGRHGRQLRRDPRRHGEHGRDGRADLSGHAGDCFRERRPRAKCWAMARTSSCHGT